MIKKNYKKIVQEQYYSFYRQEWLDSWHVGYLGKYKHKYAYDRSIRTQNERKQNAWAIDDGYKVRGKRRKLRSNWDDPSIARTYGRSWKDFTKYDKQYKKNLK